LDKADHRLKILNDLKRGVENGEFKTVFQPQLNAKRVLVGAEALVRWQHPDLGLVMPNDFITLAEESGLILDIGHIVLASALSFARAYVNQPLNNDVFQIAVNISPLEFMQKNFVSNIEQALKTAKVKPKHLILELTENVLLENVKASIVKIQALKEIGVCFSIDDFGTGYSSLSYLKQLPVNEVKIDRSFINDVLNDESDAILVEAIISLTKKLGLINVAEGIETEKQYAFLKQMGCAVYQGYLFSKPIPEAAFKEKYQ